MQPTKELTVEEAEKMQGTEFTYIFETGDTMPAYVKKFDKASGKLSCWSFSLVTDQGFVFKPINEDEKREGACCVVTGDNLKMSLKKLTTIRDTGTYTFTPIRKGRVGNFNGCVF